MAKPKIHFIVSLILTRTKNLINTSRAKCNSKKNKNDSDKYILAWVPCDDAPAGSIYIRTDNLCLKRMIDPFSDPNQKHAHKQNEGVYICNSLNVENQGGKRTSGPQYYEYVIPVLYLKIGQQFIQFEQNPFQKEQSK